MKLFQTLTSRKKCTIWINKIWWLRKGTIGVLFRTSRQKKIKNNHYVSLVNICFALRIFWKWSGRFVWAENTRALEDSLVLFPVQKCVKKGRLTHWQNVLSTVKSSGQPIYLENRVENDCKMTVRSTSVYIFERTWSILRGVHLVLTSR